MNPSKAVQRWVNEEIERIAMRLERYKTANSGYNKIESVIISPSVTSILSNPRPTDNQVAGTGTGSGAGTGASAHPRGILSRACSETDEIYSNISYNSSAISEKEESPVPKKFVHYRSCATRIT